MNEMIAGILFLILSIVVYLETLKMPPFEYGAIGDAAFPQGIAILMALLSVILIVSKLVGLSKTKEKRKPIDFKKLFEEYRLVAVALISFIVYICLIKWLGFVLPTFVYVVSIAWFLSPKLKKNIPVIIIVALVLSIGMQQFFQSILGVSFPTGRLF